MTQPTNISACTYAHAHIKMLMCTAHSSALHERILLKFQMLVNYSLTFPKWPYPKHKDDHTQKNKDDLTQKLVKYANPKKEKKLKMHRSYTLLHLRSCIYPLLQLIRIRESSLCKGRASLLGDRRIADTTVTYKKSNAICPDIVIVNERLTSD